MLSPYTVQRVYERSMLELAREHGQGREATLARQRKESVAARLTLQALEADPAPVSSRGSQLRARLATALVALAARLDPTPSEPTVAPQPLGTTPA